jgi:hypothetical protein
LCGGLCDALHAAKLGSVLDDQRKSQCGVVTRLQALAAGLTDEAIEANLVAGRWRRLHRGVYATFSGPPPRRAQLWAAVLCAGRDALLSHESAAELMGLLDRPSTLIHVTVPHSRTVHRIPGVVIHRSRRAHLVRHPTRAPPQSRVEETVLDLAQTAASLDDAVAWLAKAVGARQTTPARLAICLRGRPRLRWRAALSAALADVATGCHSPLELAYLREVERAHGLPRADRQAMRARRGGRRYDDVLYRAYRTRVELDGRAAHPEPARRRDRRADNDAVLSGDRPLRYGYGDVHEEPCQVAVQVVVVLRAGGWTGRPRRCRRPGCVIR